MRNYHMLTINVLFLESDPRKKNHDLISCMINIICNQEFCF